MSKGIIRFLASLIGTKEALSQETLNLHKQKNMLLTNGYQPPIPTKMLNQRQKRKRAKW